VTEEELLAIAIYYRVSTTKQHTEAQRHEIKEWIKAKGYPEAELLEFADEGISGISSARSGFRKLLKAIDNGEITKLITFEMSRLSRDFMTFLKVLELCQKRGVEIEIPNGDAKSFVTAKDKLMRSIEAFMATEERESIGRRIAAGIRNAQAKGIKIGAKKGERRKLGYIKSYSDDPVDGELVAQLTKLRHSGLSTYQLAEVLGISQSKVVRILKQVS